MQEEPHATGLPVLEHLEIHSLLPMFRLGSFGLAHRIEERFSATTVVSQSFGTCTLSLSGQVSFVFRAQTFMHPVGAVSSPCVLRRQYLERKVVVWPIPPSYTAHVKPFCRHAPFTSYEPKYENKFDESKRFDKEKRSSHSDSSGRKCLKKNSEQFTTSTSFSAFRQL